MSFAIARHLESFGTVCEKIVGQGRAISEASKSSRAIPSCVQIALSLRLHTGGSTLSCAFLTTLGRSRGLGWRIHESVEDTKLSTNKQHTLSIGW